MTLKMIVILGIITGMLFVVTMIVFMCLGRDHGWTPFCLLKEINCIHADDGTDCEQCVYCKTEEKR